MKRFVDIRGQATAYRFAWFDTGCDHFEEFDGSQVWDTWDNFADDYAHTDRVMTSDLERYRVLCPAWVFSPPQEGDEEREEATYEKMNSGMLNESKERRQT